MKQECQNANCYIWVVSTQGISHYFFCTFTKFSKMNSLKNNKRRSKYVEKL